MSKINSVVKIGLLGLLLWVGVAGVMIVMAETGKHVLADLIETTQAGPLTISEADQYARLTDAQPESEATEPGLTISAMAAHPNNPAIRYAGTAGGSVFTDYSLWYSLDDGQTWQSFNLSLPANSEGVLPVVTALTVDPQHPETLYVGAEGRGIYRFDLSGNGYTVLGDLSLRGRSINDIVVDANSQVYALTDAGVFVTNGAAWQKLDTLPEPAVSLAAAPLDAQILYSGSASGSLYRTADGGQTWERLSNVGMKSDGTLQITALAVDTQNVVHVAVATTFEKLAGSIIYESRNGGRTWTEVTHTGQIVTDLQIEQGVIYIESDQQPGKLLDKVGERRLSAQTDLEPELELNDFRFDQAAHNVESRLSAGEKYAR